MRAGVILFAALLATTRALTFTSPTVGQSLDPTQPITVQWTSDSSDPATLNLSIDKPGGLVNNRTIARGLSTSSGNYVVAANAAAMTYGDGFLLRALGATGNILAISPSFALSVGSATTIDGQISYTWTNMFTGMPPATKIDQSVLVATSIDDDSATSSEAAMPSNRTATYPAAIASTTSTAAGNTSSGFSTSTLSRTSASSTHSSSASSASATTSQNAQTRLGSSGQIALTGAGVLAGLVALLA